MCGIVGVIDARRGIEEDLVATMRDTMAHRGPDGAGIWTSPCGRVVFAHRRLAVVDLSEGGHQPMQRDDICITFNGEIYNHGALRRQLIALGHHFTSRSDTEVVIAAYRQWGHQCLAHLSGMFALAIYDQRQQTVFLARDRAGEKPLFYSVNNGRVSFASELKALMADPALDRRINPTAMACYLAYGYVSGDQCILKDCHKLAPGHAMEIDVGSGSLRLWRYWNLPTEQTPMTVDDAADELDTLLSRSVRRQLEADVPVAVLLSGGVDSSLITALTARETQKVRTFTVSFPGQGDFDESVYARMVADHFGTEHTEIEAEPMATDLLGNLARQYDEPMADYSMIPTFMVSQAVRQHATVALGGDGGDELFGGYRHYCWLQQLESYFGYIPAPLRQATAYAARRAPMGTRARTYLVGLDGSIGRMLSHVDLFFDRHNREQLLPASMVAAIERQPEDYKQGLRPAGSILQRAMATDFDTFMVDDVLCKVDRASMLASLEVRAPFLDPDIIDFAFRLEDSLRATRTERKIVPRTLAARLMPKQLDLTRKQGFSVPINNWLATSPTREVFRDILLGNNDSIFDRAVVKNLLDLQAGGYPNGKRIFTLAMFEMWKRQYQISF